MDPIAQFLSMMPPEIMQIFADKLREQLLGAGATIGAADRAIKQPMAQWMGQEVAPHLTPENLMSTIGNFSPAGIAGPMSVGAPATLQQLVRTLSMKDQGLLRGAIKRIMQGTHEGEGDMLSWDVEGLRSGQIMEPERSQALKRLIDFEKKYQKWGEESQGLSRYSEDLATRKQK